MKLYELTTSRSGDEDYHYSMGIFDEEILEMDDIDLIELIQQSPWQIIDEEYEIYELKLNEFSLVSDRVLVESEKVKRLKILSLHHRGNKYWIKDISKLKRTIRLLKGKLK